MPLPETNATEVRFKLTGETARRFQRVQSEMNFTRAQAGRWLMERVLYSNDLHDILNGWLHKDRNK